MKLIAVAASTAAALMLALAGAVHAEPPVGRFNQPHDTAADAIWEIKPAAQGYTFRMFSYGEPSPAHLLTADERKDLWIQFWLEKGTHLDAECIGGKEHVICYVPPATRRKMRDYQLYDHNYVLYKRGDSWDEIAKTSNPLRPRRSKPIKPER